MLFPDIKADLIPTPRSVLTSSLFEGDGKHVVFSCVKIKCRKVVDTALFSLFDVLAYYIDSPLKDR